MANNDVRRARRRARAMLNNPDEPLRSRVEDAIGDLLHLVKPDEWEEVLRRAVVDAFEERHGWHTAEHATVFIDGLRYPDTKKRGNA